MAKGEARQKTCLTCNSSFTAHRSDACFCSFRCMRNSLSNKEYLQKYNKSFNGKWTQIVSKCKKLGQELGLTKEECIELWQQPCHYCTKSLDGAQGISLDRINNNLSYIKGNVLPCCGTCNKIRNTFLTVEEMEVAMKAVLEFRKSKMIGGVVVPFEGKPLC